MIQISEIYNAPQGEGPFIGRQMLFVRVNRCPLSCTWCDTRFTWDKNHPDYGKGVESYSASGLAQKMIDSAKSLSPHEPMAVTFTGGEPMIYQNELPEVIDLFRGHYRIPIEIETSGIVMPSQAMLLRCHFNVSQKLPSSGNEKIATDKLFNRKITRMFALHRATFKVVVAEEDDKIAIPLYVAWLRKATEGIIPWHQLRTRIYLMPEGVTAERIAARQGRIIELSQKLGVCATTRMHVTAFGEDRKR